MKILFYYRGAESFGIEYISAVLKAAGHQTELLFDPGFDDTFFFKFDIFKKLKVKEKLLEQARRFSPNLIAFSSITNLYPYVKEMAKILKEELKVPTVIGGIHPTALPDYVLKEDYFDMLCVGEGEYAMLELVNRMEEDRDFSGIENIWIKHNGKIIRNKERPLIEDLDTLPFPDKDIFYAKGVSWKSIQIVTARECPYYCTFCVNSFYLKKYGPRPIRRRSVDNVIAELKIYKKKYNPFFVYFEDDVFTYSLQWLEEFSYKYKNEIGIKFLVNVHPHTINKKVVYLLKEAGCWCVCMGIQSGDENLRKTLLKRYDTNLEIIEAVRILKEAKIHVSTDFIFGLPGETPQQAWESVLFNNKIGPSSTSTFIFYPFPKTELAEFSYKNGFIDDESIEMINKGEGSYHTTSILKNSNRDFLLNIAYTLPLFSKFPFLIQNGFFKKLCNRPNTRIHKFISIVSLPFWNPALFWGRFLNYLNMFWAYIFS